MNVNIDNIRCLESGEGLRGRARTGVSLHCHTLHSKEMLDFIPYYASRIPIASFFWKRYLRRSVEQYGREPDFSKGHWTPPLTGSGVLESETKSMAALGLDSLVSITDHDSISANLQLCARNDADPVPISIEWTVPFEQGFFHIGVHNLPIDRAVRIKDDLLSFTFAGKVPDNERLHELFRTLNEIPEVLVVFNHPIWDIEMIGQKAHDLLLERFVAEHGKWIHAIEINGFRSWKENVAAHDLAVSLGLPIVSGGDRHCLQQNTIINFTNAASFAEFASEVRDDHHSELAILDGYRSPLPCRQLRSIKQIVADYPEFPAGRSLWSDRVNIDRGDGTGLISLTEHWGGRTPGWTLPIFLALRVLAHPVMEPLIALAFGDTDIGRDDKTETIVVTNPVPTLETLIGR